MAELMVPIVFHACGRAIMVKVEQILTFPCSTESIMRHPHFARGLDDIRAGASFDYQAEDSFWAYERGRQFGCIAPRSMPLFINGKLNRKAVVLFDVACDRKLIR
jgi:hypothetical protein